LSPRSSIWIDFPLSTGSELTAGGSYRLYFGLMFDAVIVEVGTARQKLAFEALLEERRRRGLYPRELDFQVISDPDGGRVGSGGALLNVFSLIEKRYSGRQRIFIVQAGGESRRMPCFVPEGKLFAPVPVGSSNMIPPVLLDLLLTAFLSYPWQEGEIVLASGDAVVDFDPDALTQERAPLCGFARLSTLDEGSRHGVFKIREGKGEVLDFYQKMPAEFLREHAALDGNFCALDTGIVSLSRQAKEAFDGLAMIRTDSDATVGELTQSGALYFDLYLELLSAAIPDLSLTSYLERMAGRSRLAPRILSGIHERLSPLRLRAALLKRSRFIHFGDLPEFFEAARAVNAGELLPFYEHDRAELAPENRGEWILSNSIAVTGKHSAEKRVFCESCESLVLGEPGDNDLFIGLSNIELDFRIPDGMCLEGRNNKLGDFLLVYGVHDTWKPVKKPEELMFCGVPFSRWLQERSIGLEQVASAAATDLYEAHLWVPGTKPDRLRGYLDPQATDAEWRRWFLESKRHGLREINEADDPMERERRRMRIRRGLLREQVLSGSGWRSLTCRDFLESFSCDDAAALDRILDETDDVLISIYRRHLRGSIAGGCRPDSIQNLGIDYLSDYHAGCLPPRAIKRDQIVWARSPVRLDLAGGWTDTPPYTLREGGTVLNVAVDLNGQPPIQVFCRPIEEPEIRLHSIDTGVSEVIRTFDDLQGYSSARSAFALPIAALRLIGLSPEVCGSRSLSEEMGRIGCGLEITLLCAVPKGSGLGTSSILAGAILSALHRFFGVVHEQDRLFREVLQMEQMLTTGGGWQDQIGGLVGGVKYIETQPGLKPRPLIYQLDPYLFEDPQSSGCLTLFYTGMTRLAKNILQEVVDQVNGMEPAYLFTVRGLKELAQQAREAISLRSLPQLAEVLNRSWRSNQHIHPSTTNDDIEAMLDDLKELYIGMKLLGAGGGGYAIFISESSAQASLLRQRLREKHENDRARIVEMSLNRKGLLVSVS
jgi:galactokinase/mevalonate kinase-like predicted kinase